MYQAIQWAKHSTSGEQVEADGSRLINFYPVAPASPKTDSKVPVILYGTPGIKRWMTLPAPRVPGALTTAAVDAVYALRVIDSPSLGVFVVGVTGQYEVFWKKLATRYLPYAHAFRSGGAVNLLTVTDAEKAFFTAEDEERAQGPVQLADDGRYVMVVTSHAVKMLDLQAASTGSGTKVLSQIEAPTPDDASATLPDQEWVGCAWVDGYFFLLSRAGQIFHSLLNQIEFDQIEFNYASSKPDEGVGLAAFERQLYVFGSRSIEVWRNAGTQPFAFQRINEWSIDTGCAAAATIQVDTTGLYMLGSDGIVYLVKGARLGRLSTESVEADIFRSDMDKARAFFYVEQGHRFYSLTLDINGTKKNWTLDMSTRLWHERTATDILAAARYENLTVVGREGNRHLHEMSLRWGTVDDAAVGREAVAPVMHANQRRTTISSLQLDVPRAGAIDRDLPAYADVPAAAETIRLEYTDDAGENWSPVGAAAGKPLTSVRHKWNRAGQFRGGRNYRIRITAARPVTVLGAYAEIVPSTD